VHIGYLFAFACRDVLLVCAEGRPVTLIKFIVLYTGYCLYGRPVFYGARCCIKEKVKGSYVGGETGNIYGQDFIPLTCGRENNAPGRAAAGDSAGRKPGHDPSFSSAPAASRTFLKATQCRLF